MGDTFGGEWHRPRNDRRHDRQRGHSMPELQDRASYDHQPANDCASALLLLTVLATTTVAIIRKGRTT
ncbi:hypothetical protein ABZ890_39540 [Streptomyces sp. NPDC046984]|uniref:hypothetical protein n=1 Tax=Streptomyces sp. NPDC046984 TaxID=3155138 RepID=UPI0033DCE39F